MWSLPQTSGYSYLRVTVIWIDVHPVGETPIHTTRTLHTPVHIRSAYASCGSPQTWQPFTSHQQHWTNPVAPEKKGSRHNPSPTEWSADPPPSFSPNTAIRVVIKAKHMLTNKLHRFLGPITSTCDRYVQYLLMRANPSVLNRHRWGLQS
jgi:hypothetical protein